jgi:hypothetical protein
VAGAENSPFTSGGVGVGFGVVGVVFEVASGVDCFEPIYFENKFFKIAKMLDEVVNCNKNRF